MALLPLQLQIISDLHLETPIAAPSYQKDNIHVEASNLCLLGDIGLVKDDALFAFLRTTLEKSRGTRIFYIIGNHEAYQMTFESALKRLRAFEEEARSELGGRFIPLNRTRFDVDSTTTILGCTLWSAISSEQAAEAQLRLTDFNEQRGIRGWSLEQHLSHHGLDREWLNDQVRELQEKEPHRRIATLTHHSPTMQSEAIEPRHRTSTQSTCFATDLSSELSWTSPMVKLWAFGHTHYSCNFRDGQTGKLVVANQMGYHSLNGRPRRTKTLIVEVGREEWVAKEISPPPPLPRENRRRASEMIEEGQKGETIGASPSRKGFVERVLGRFRRSGREDFKR